MLTNLTGAGAPDLLRSATKSVTFTGGAGAGAVGTVALFAVTGRVLIWVTIPRCTASLTSGGAATIALKVATLTDEVSTATDVDDGDILFGATSPALGDGANAFGGALTVSPLVVEDDDMELVIGTASITAGAFTVDVFWSPYSTGASIVAA